MSNMEDLIISVNGFVENHPLNQVEGVAIKIFDSPIIGIANAGDPLFDQLKEETVSGPHHMTPKEWFPEAKTVISYFLPFTNEVRKSNGVGSEYPSYEWLYGRIEGERFNREVMKFIAEKVIEMGGCALIPAEDSRISSINNRSNWSERHIAYIAGIGTFGLSKSLITEKGSAGRVGSVITNLSYQTTDRTYQEIYEYCNHCGACIHRCPVSAINQEGKKHEPCDAFLSLTKEKFAPRYGCGKCQTAVPCEGRAPGKKGAEIGYL
ncbi:epoxyqueuosine reductase QueG [Anaerosolibacter carboniphilus]|uniref:Epoxyqueuosine reductase QueG n=2 Tax=Anaerosolibacter carboniphilus TaxID=1417629 RepID=A0A841KPA0_9FIRM|nr:epoxyqueuosine reductase QueG [Anaerosolibacter carboniphilus]